MNLTNKLSKVHFLQYGQTMMIEYNGNIKQAISTLKSMCGKVQIIYSQSYKRDGFLPEGYYTIESV